MSSNFSDLLLALTSNDKATRSAAEQFYQQQLSSNAETTINLLLDCLSTHSNAPVVRSLAGVLLRRAIEKQSKTLSPLTITELRNKLMNIWANEGDPHLLQRVAHVVAQSAAFAPWPQLIPSVLGFAEGASSVKLVAILHMIEIVSAYCPQDIHGCLSILGPFLAKLIVVEDGNIQIACAKVVGACMVVLNDETARNSFKTAILPILQIIQKGLKNGSETEIVEIINYFVCVVFLEPTYFQENLSEVLTAMLTIGNCEDFEFSTRSVASELLVSIAEAAPALARRCNGFINGVIALSLSFMLELEEDDNEFAQGPYTQEPLDENAAIGDESLERITSGLGGKSVTDLVLSVAQQNMGSPQSKYRRAAVVAVTRLAEGDGKFFRKFFKQAMVFIAAAVQDSSPRVQFEGINGLGRFAALYPEESSTFVSGFAPLLTKVLTKDSGCCEKVKGHAANALINVFNPDHCDPEKWTLPIEEVINPLLEALLTCLQLGSIEVKNPCLSVVGCISRVLGEDFAPYYAVFMPGLKTLLTELANIQTNNIATSTLRGKAMECAGLIAESVGDEVFKPDAMEVMQLLLHSMGQECNKDITFDYALPACARVSKALGSDFERFLPVVMDPLLKGAAEEIDDAEIQTPEDDEDNDDDENKNNFNTHAVQRKTQAARILYEFADSLKGFLKNYSLSSLEVLVKLVVNPKSADIRSSSSLAMAKMFEAMLNAMELGFLVEGQLNNFNVTSVLSTCIFTLIQMLNNEIDETARACEVEAIRDILGACYDSGKIENSNCAKSGFIVCPDLNMSQTISKAILTLCGESLARFNQQVEFLKQSKGLDDEDKERMTEELEEEEDLLGTLVDVIGQCLKLHGNNFMDFFDSNIAPAFSPYLNPTAGYASGLQAVAVCLIDDCIEFGGEKAQKYLPTAIQVFLHHTQHADDHTVLRQSSVFGIAKAAAVAPEIFKNFIPTVLPCLLGLLQKLSDAESNADDGLEENDGIIDNCFAAIGAIVNNLSYRETIKTCSNLNINFLYGLWLKNLPLRTDESQNKISNNLLCTALEKEDNVVFGDNMRENIAEIFRIFAEAVSNGEGVSDNKKKTNSPNSVTNGLENQLEQANPILRKMREILCKFSTQPSESDLGKAVHFAFSNLDPELQAALNTLL